MTSAGGPFEAAGNYITGVRPQSNGNTLFLTNYPEGHADYYMGHCNEKGWAGFTTNGSFSSENSAWHHFSSDMAVPDENTIVVLEHKMPYNGGLREVYLSKYHYLYNAPAGQLRYTLEWHKKLFSHPTLDAAAGRIKQVAGGGYIAVSSVKIASNPIRFNPLITRVDEQGTVLWDRILDAPEHSPVADVVQAPDGGFFLLRTILSIATPQTAAVWLVKLSSNGSVEWQQLVTGQGTEMGNAFALSADGNLLLCGYNPTTSGLFLIKTDLTGTILWRQDYAFPAQSGVFISRLLETPDHQIALVGTYQNDGFIMKVSAIGAPVWEKRYARSGRIIRINDAAISPDGGFVAAGAIQTDNNPPLAYIFKTDFNGVIKPGLIRGNVYGDINMDCSQWPAEAGLANLTVTAFQDSTHIFYGTTDSLGNYRIECDTGQYQVSIALPSPYWTVCQNQVPVFIHYLDSITVNFPVQSAINCPYMTVEHSTSRVRPCQTTTFYVKYCNLGTTTAQNARVEIRLDTIFTFLNGVIPPSSNINHVLTFPLGDVAPLSCQQFSFTAEVSCQASVGQVACSSAHIFPDSLCLPGGPNWSGALITAEGVCQGDSVQFTLRNIGSGPSQPLEYIVIEDAVLLRQGNFQLDPNEEIVVSEPANGATLHLIAQQEPGIPGNTQPLAAVEACAGSGGNPISVGFFNQFAQNDASDYLSEYCIPVVNSYDPNDKQAFPTGYSEAHYIFPETELEYQIRFQNTGTDTAYRVVLLDTLSALLDPASVRLGTTSHPCSLKVEENGILRFTFQPISLPHKAINEAGSQGFVTFRARQRKGNRMGAQIHNRAGIYFDFNAPVITNTVTHTLHQNLLRVTSFVKETGAPEVQVEAYPNPFAEQIRFELEQQPDTEVYLELFDAQGQIQRRLPFAGTSLQLAREDLSTGLYFFALRDGRGRVLGRGSIVAE